MIKITQTNSKKTNNPSVTKINKFIIKIKLKLNNNNSNKTMKNYCPVGIRNLKKTWLIIKQFL